MRLPKDVSGVQLAKKLEEYGYRITRQTGSHLRLTPQVNGEHHITIPVHKELRTGLLNGILSDVADHLSLSRESWLKTCLENDAVRCSFYRHPHRSAAR